MTTVACVWVRGNVPYSVEYVTRLREMVARHLDRPYRFCCLTDRPRRFAGTLIEAIKIQCPRPLAGWWSKLEIFHSKRGLTGRVLYLDLDTLIVDSLAPIVDYQAPFALVPHAGEFNGARGRAVVKRFNSSVMVWDAGVNARLFDDWDRSVAKRLHGDQDWIGEQMPDAAMMPAAWFPRLSQIQDGPVPSGAKVILAKAPKNIEASARWPWVNAIWRAA